MHISAKVSLACAIVGFSLGATGCGGDAVGSGESQVGVRYGVDYSFSRPSPSALRADGYTFAARYLSNGSSKDLSAAEAQSLIGAGIDVVLVWEGSATDALSGYARGVADAQHAAVNAAADGAPGSRPIYFAIDFDVQPGQLAAVESYFDGVASVIGVGRAGAYGGYYVIDQLFNANKIKWGWQTYAWSYGQWDSRAQVRQIQNGILNGTCDKDQAIAADFGQWGTGSALGSAPSVVEQAFQANTGSLWTVGSAGNRDWALGMYAGSSPAIAALGGGGFEVAFEANTTSLWTVGDGGNKDWGLGMMAGTSPAICALSGGGFEVAFQANTGNLWTVGDAGNTDWKLGMMSGTNPSIACLDTGGFEVAFQANTTNLWTVGNAGNKDWALGMQNASSPSIAALPGGKFEVAFEANTTSLWTVGDAGDRDWSLGMYAGTSPSITALDSGGFEVAFQANTTNLWTVGSAGDKDWALGMMPGSSPTIAGLPGGGFRASFEANTTNLWSAGTDGVTDWQLGMMKGTSPSGS